MNIHHNPMLRLGTLIAALAERTTRARSERGEGVISMAIAVLIVAFLGVLMWAAFKGIWSDTEGDIRDQVDQIGS